VRYDFANILFAGPCNARCTFCIGRQIDPRLSVNNLDEYPPRNLDRFLALVVEYEIKQVVFTGTTTDPQLYRPEGRLLAYLRRRLPTDTQISLHTNGRLALKKIDVLNQYDRVCISFPSFNPATYHKMMGVRSVPDLAQIVERAQVPVKVSCVIDEHNVAELSGFLERCYALGIKRVVLRRLYGDTRAWDISAALKPRSHYRGNPVYNYHGMEVTVWNFGDCDCRSLNLFSNGTISGSYLLSSAYEEAVVHS
jgi:molybdenum cofactor biosynthesis enzyme MoaA